MATRTPESWSPKAGMVLAMAGSAIGLGNFLRFPVQAIRHDGGAFMIPYLCALLLLGLPLMWMEMSLGRYGGIWGRHNLPGIYDAATRRPWAKYLGVFGLFVPFVIIVYYTYLQSWILGYSALAAMGAFKEAGAQGMRGGVTLLSGYLDLNHSGMSVPWFAIGCLLLTVLVNFHILSRGITAGFGKFTQIAVPLLFVLSGLLVVRVLLLPGAWEGMEFLWRPDFSQLKDPGIWMAATGQVLFSLSLGLGIMVTYASYLRKEDDVALSGLTTVSLSTFGEVILGASIVVPLAAQFMLTSLVTTSMSTALHNLVPGSPYGLAFVVMPEIFKSLPFGGQIGTLWFLLLFFVGITTSITLLRPLVAFFQDELGWTRRKGARVVLFAALLYLAPVVLFQQYGFFDEMDFWAGTFLLVVGALVEVLIFIFVLGMSRGWQGIRTGARIPVPGLVKFLLRYIVPLYLIVLLVAWGMRGAWDKLILTNVPVADQPFVIASRVVMGVVLLGMLLMLRQIWQHHGMPVETPVEEGERDVV